MKNNIAAKMKLEVDAAVSAVVSSVGCKHSTFRTQVNLLSEKSAQFKNL